MSFEKDVVVVTNCDVNVGVKGEECYDSFERTFSVIRTRHDERCEVHEVHDAEGEVMARCSTYAKAVAVAYALNHVPATPGGFSPDKANPRTPVGGMEHEDPKRA